MKLGLYVKWDKGSIRSGGNVIGDELHGEAMVRALRNFPEVGECALYAPNHLPSGKLDVMIYLNDTPPEERWARKHLLYLQNAFGEGSDKALASLRRHGYDGYAFISRKLLDAHLREGYRGIFLPFGVDTSVFHPRPKEPRYAFEVSYVGNDIKGEARSNLYLLPAARFDFGLFGNWRTQKLFWRNRPYQRRFAKISRGKIPQEDVPILYSSSRINLNCTAQDCVDWDVITLRTYEVLACGGFLITDRVPAAERELADCAVFTDGGPDLEEKIRLYLEKPAARERIARNGYEYAIRFATMESRMATLLEYMKSLA
jgi:spore maturation protein CgeB